MSAGTYRKHQSSATSTSCQEAEMASNNLRELQETGNHEDPVHRLRLLCLSRGPTGILHLGRIFRRLDDGGKKNLTFDEFTLGLREMGLTITDDEIWDIFSKFDTVEYNGTLGINVDEFLVHIRAPLSETRCKAIDLAFNKLDKNLEGKISMQHLRRIYNVKTQPRYISGELSEENILDAFLINFEEDATIDGNITKEEFYNYYAGISASIDTDCYFDLMMRQAYKL